MHRATANVGADAIEITMGFERLFELLRRLSPADGTSLTAGSTLRRLEQSGAHRLSDLAVAEGVTQPAMTQLVSRLERDGYAARGNDPADGRVVVVRITAAGRALLRRRRAVRAERLAALLADLDPTDRAAIKTAITALDRLGGPPSDPPAPGRSSGGAPARSGSTTTPAPPAPAQQVRPAPQAPERRTATTKGTARAVR